jgi:CheY-like chemotaxis protein
MSAIGILLCDDLLFTSRISGTARALGLEMRTARNVAALEEIARQQEPACVIVDVHHPGLNLPALVAAVRRGAACTIVAYGSHVAADVLQAARDAGCDVVLPRSKFVDTLADEMPRWYATGSAKPPREVP